jgi:hypothetical protein
LCRQIFIFETRISRRSAARGQSLHLKARCADKQAGICSPGKTAIQTWAAEVVRHSGRQKRSQRHPLKPIYRGALPDPPAPTTPAPSASRSRQRRPSMTPSGQMLGGSIAAALRRPWSDHCGLHTTSSPPVLDPVCGQMRASPRRRATQLRETFPRRRRGRRSIRGRVRPVRADVSTGEHRWRLSSSNVWPLQVMARSNLS